MGAGLNPHQEAGRAYGTIMETALNDVVIYL